MIKRIRKNQKGFTLVELIVVIAILGVLAMLIVPRIMGSVKDSEDKTDIGNARTIASEIAVYNAQHDPDIKNNATAGCVTSAEFTGPASALTGLSLPTGVTWPDPTIVKIMVDTKGNASVAIITATP